MSEELFPVPVQLSPRLAWMRKHKVTVNSADFNPSVMCAGSDKFKAIGTGSNTHEALADWAVKNAIPLWNEEAI